MESKKLLAILSSQIQKTATGWAVEEGDGPGDPVGPTYGTFRVAAGAYLALEYPTADVVASGFVYFPDGPSIGSIVKSELVALGVQESRIILLDNTRKTYLELKELAMLVEQGYEEVLIITSEWHAPRVEAMLKDWSVPRARVVAAEEVLLRHDAAQWRARIERMRADPRIAERIELERKGIEDIKAGTYRY